MQLSEDIIQEMIFKWYHNKYCLKTHSPQHIIFSVPNGGYRNKREAMKFKATGLISGISDLIIVQPGRIIFVEVKTQKGTQSVSQKRFEKIVTLLGFQYILVRSLDDFKKIIL